MKLRKIFIISVLLFGTACSSKNELIIIPREDTIKALQAVGDSRFTMNIPEGWIIETMGEFQNFGLRAYDPENPNRSIFYYGTMSPWMKSEGAKDFWAWYAATGYPNSKIYADAPVLYDASVEGLYTSFNVFTEFAQTYGIQHEFPDFSSFEVLEQFQTSTEMVNYALDESTLRLRLDDNGYPIDAMVTATIVDAMAYPVNGIDAGYYTAYRISGIMAPADDFMHHEARLTESLASFQYSEAYIEEGVRLIEWGTDQAKKLQQTLNQTAQIINDAWSYRNKVNDAANAKFISYIRGKAYLQDPKTGQTYEGDPAVIEDYLKDPTRFTKSDLIEIKDTDPAFGQPISGVIKP